jgi:hypothetical protein
MLFDFSHAREKVINLFREPGVTRSQLFEPFNAPMNHRNLRSYLAQLIMRLLERFIDMFELIHHFRLESATSSFVAMCSTTCVSI